MVAEDTGRAVPALTDTGCQVPEEWRQSGRRVILLELSLELGSVRFHKLLPHKRFKLEARVGIGRLKRRF